MQLDENREVTAGKVRKRRQEPMEFRGEEERKEGITEQRGGIGQGGYAIQLVQLRSSQA